MKVLAIIEANVMEDEQVFEYFRGVKSAVENDIGIYFRGEAEFKGWGSFAVPELVFSYCDFLGALYTGYLEQGNLTRRALEFIKKFFTKVNQKYDEYAEIMYDMYRHGTVHAFEPKTYKIGGKKVSWLVGKGTSEHLAFRATTAEEKARGFIADYMLCLDVKQLYLDLKSSFDLFIKELESEPTLITQSSRIISKFHESEPKKNIKTFLKNKIKRI